MTKKIFRSILLVAGIVLLASFLLVLGCLYNYFGTLQDAQMQDTLDLTALALEQGGKSYLQGIDSDRYRFTWLDADGAVLFDTPAPSGSHAALEKTTSAAKRLADGSELRISYAQANAGVLLVGMVQPICAVLAAALILSAILAHRLSKRIVEPLNTLDLDHPLDNNVYEELSPLLNRINRQHRQIAAQVRDLAQKQSEFMQITGSLQEGLILLDNRGTIVSMNPAAQRLFEADGHAVGRDFMTLDHSAAMNTAIHTAMETGHSEMHAAHFGRVYQFDVTRIETDGAALGAAILAFDITEQETAEQMRREFTANVSHELKTPLQGIIGSAELLENGMVQPEDVPRFVGHIRTEAQRLMTLIVDIIRLAQLDEGVELPLEPVELLSLTQEAADAVQKAAAEKQVTISVEGSPVIVRGVRPLLYEVVLNLCDNAVKYNTAHGRVSVSVASDGSAALLTVADTGIGIAPEHQSRIFERFYRVDKSHSKASGGTGLGLSIVKHAVQFHHGRIALESAPGKGTTIRVTLPLNPA